MTRPARPGRAAGRRGVFLPVLGLALLLAVWRVAAGDPATDRIEAALLDLRFQVRGNWDPAPHVALVTVGEADMARVGNVPALRAALAEAVPAILGAGARAVAVDLLLLEPSAADAALAAALGGGPTLLAVAGLNAAPGEGPAGEAPLPPELRAALDRSAVPVVVGPPPAGAGRLLLLPVPGLAGSARLAHVNIVRAPDGAAREIPLVLETGEGRVLPALPLAAAALAEGTELRVYRGDRVEAGPRLLPLGPGGTVVIDHPGAAPGGAGLLDVLAGRVAAGAFEGRIVFVGATADSLGDTFVTPFRADAPGVEILAGVAAAILEDRRIRRDGTAAALSAGLALLAAAGAFAAVLIPRGPVAPLALAGAAGAVAVALQAGFAGAGLWLDATAAAGALLAGALAGGVVRHRSAADRAGEMERERGNLARFVAPALADRLAREGIPAFHGRQQQAAVLFVDLEGFTALTETADPAATTRFLRRLHAEFEDAAARAGGVVVDYQGDGAMIAFGLPDPAPDDATRALACAEALVAGAAALRAVAPDGRAPRLRASVHFGPATAAVLGGARQAVVTLAGDTVNVASRLQETAKEHGVALVATREALAAAGPEAAARYAFLVRTRVRGRAAETEVWAYRPPS